MPRIDAHTHLVGDHAQTVALLEELDLKVLNIGVAESDGRPWREHLAMYRQLADEHPNRYAWVTTFDLPDCDDPHYADRAIEALDRDFAAGAVGCKVWKNVGMEIHKPDGQHLLVDDPVFEPIFAHLEKIGRPLLMHIAEPLACWLPPTKGDPHYEYFIRHPEWHMYGRDDVMSHAELMAARDRVVERHPNLRVIGAHLGSLEYDLNEIASRFDRYPNFAVDTAGRLFDLTHYCDASSLRKFLVRYQDRVLWATDLVRFKAHSSLTDEQREDDLGHIRRQYGCEYDFYANDGTTWLFDRPVERLGLPEDVLEKLFFENARTWYPGV